MPSLDQYMAQYDHEHTNPWNKVMHAIGIPLIITGIIRDLAFHYRAVLSTESALRFRGQAPKQSTSVARPRMGQIARENN